MSSKKRSNDSVISCKKIRKLDSSESESEESEMSEVQVDLSGFELAPCDFTGIRLLLQQLFLKSHVDLSDMTNYLIDQLDIGSVIKESEIDQNMETDDEINVDDTVYAVISIVDFAPNPDAKFKTQLKNYILELSKQHATEIAKNTIHSVLNDPKNSVCILINERYLNLPPTISVPSFSKLKSEIDAMSKKKTKYNFTHYLMISKLYKIPSSKKKNSNSQLCEVVWCNAEEEVFDQEADSRFEFPVSKESDSGLSGSWTEDDIEMLPFRRVLLFSTLKFDTIIEKISNFTQ